VLYTEQQTFLSIRKKMRIIVKHINFGVAFRARVKKIRASENCGKGIKIARGIKIANYDDDRAHGSVIR